MEIVCIEEKILDRNLQDGLRILTRIIARDFISKHVVDGDCKSDSTNNGHIQDK